MCKVQIIISDILVPSDPRHQFENPIDVNARHNPNSCRPQGLGGVSSNDVRECSDLSEASGPRGARVADMSATPNLSGT